MAARRVLYVLALCGAVALHLCWTKYITWLVLCVLALLPVLSVLVTLPYFLRYRLQLQSRPRQQVAHNGFASLRLAPPAPVTLVRLRVQADNLFYTAGEQRRYRLTPGRDGALEVPFGARQCGLVRLSVQQPRMLDVMGLVALPLRVPQPVKVLVAPKRARFPGSIEQATGTSDALKPPTPAKVGEREMQGVRDYRAGDALRDVHWKLSGRRDEVVVREYTQNADNTVYIAVTWSGQPERLQRVLSRLLGVVEYLLDKNLPCTLLWAEPREGGRVELYEFPLEDGDALERLLWDVLSKSPAAEELDLPVGFFAGQADRRVLMIAHDAVSLFEGGVCKEAFR